MMPINLEPLKLKVCAVELLQSNFCSQPHWYIKTLMCSGLLFGLEVSVMVCFERISNYEMHLFAQQCFVSYFGLLMPESTFLFDIIKLWRGMWKWKKKLKQKQEVGAQQSLWTDVQGWIWPTLSSTNDIPGRFSSRLQGQVEFWLSLWRFVVLRQNWRNTHTHTHWLVWMLDGRRWILPIKQGRMDAWMDGWQAEWMGSKK